MKLFSPDLLKAFTAGFALTALAMSNSLVPGLWGDVLAFIA